jgi:glycosyltransferase involved in cell wall biosynthesis
VTSADPTRIARIITRLNVGGPAIQAVTLSERLEACGYHTLLLHGRLGPGEGDMRYLVPPNPRFDLESVPALQREVAPIADVAALGQITALLRRFRPHIVHTHMAKAGTIGRLSATIYNATVARDARARIVHTYHGHVLDGYFTPAVAAAFSTAERFLARRSDALIAVSPLVQRDLIEAHRIGDSARFRVVPLGFDLRPFVVIGDAERAAARAQFGLDPGAHVVSIVGRLTAIKQPEVFLDAAARIAAADPRAAFLVAGGGELETALRAQATRLGIDARVRFLGWQRTVASVYAASDLVAVTSRNEGTPVALIESMAAGVPGVAFAVGGVPDVISHPDLGALVADSSAGAFADRAIALLRDDSARRRMGEQARAAVCARYGLDRLVRDIDALYRELL